MSAQMGSPWHRSNNAWVLRDEAAFVSPPLHSSVNSSVCVSVFSLSLCLLWKHGFPCMPLSKRMSLSEKSPHSTEPSLTRQAKKQAGSSAGRCVERKRGGTKIQLGAGEGKKRSNQRSEMNGWKMEADGRDWAIRMYHYHRREREKHDSTSSCACTPSQTPKLTEE